jgi:ADP-heptose:LPS heptosyltransferase
VPFPGFPGIAEQFFEPRKVTRFFFNMQQEDFDLAIQMQGSGVNSNPFSLLLGAKATAGFIRPEDLPGHLDAALPLPEQGHEIERVLALVEFLGVERQGLQTEFPLWEEDCQQAEILLEGLQPPLIGLHPAARDLTRRWPAERFAKTAKQIQAERGGTLVCIGDSETRPTAEGVLHAAGGPARNLAGVTSLGALGAVIKRLSILITNDSGPAHIAYALGTPTVTIFGGDEPQRYGALMPGPFRMLAHPVPCRPCNYSECPIGYICLEQITPDQVVRAAFEVMR